MPGSFNSPCSGLSDTHNNVPYGTRNRNPLAAIVRAAYGDATGHIFMVGFWFGLVALLAVLFLKEVPLRTTVSMAEEVATASVTATGAPDVSEHVVVGSADEPYAVAATSARSRGSQHG